MLGYKKGVFLIMKTNMHKYFLLHVSKLELFALCKIGFIIICRQLDRLAIGI